MYVAHRDTGTPLCASHLPKGREFLKQGHVEVDQMPPDPPLDYRWDGSDWKKTPEAERAEAKQRRREQYPPIGDQLDAIWKVLNQRRLGGEQLPQEADDMLGRILAVKRDHPIP